MSTMMLRANVRALLIGSAMPILCCGTAFAATQDIAQPVVPQSPAAPSSSIPGQAQDAQDIVVTAQRRSETLQSVPLAVSAVSGDSMKERNISNLSQLSQQVPNLYIGDQVGQARVTLRGIGIESISTGTDGSIAFNTDGVYFSRTATALASFYDLERLEVLRGPQGTLYGRNATGGSVNLITAKPTSTPEGYVNLTYGNYDTFTTEGAFGGPIAGDKVRARVSFQTQQHDGYGRNVVTGNDVDDKNSKAIRGLLEFRPTDRLSLLLTADYYHSDDHSNVYHYLGAGAQTAAGVPIVPAVLRLGGFVASDPRDIASGRDPRSRQTFYGGLANLTYEGDGFVIKSLTSARRSKYLVKDTDVSGGSIVLTPLQISEDSKQFSQELQLSTESEKNKFVSGLYYFHESNIGQQFVPYNGLLVGRGDTFLQGFFGGGRIKTKAGAIYAQDTYSVTPELRLTLGARYSIEKKSVDDQSQFDLARPFSLTNPILTPHHIDDKTFRSFTPKIGIDYNIAPDVMFYASFSKGFKSGTYNLGGVSPALRPEKVDAYEVGLKSTFLDRRVRANLAGFYYDYSDLQVGLVRGVLLSLENAATARIYGIEGELTVRPIDAPLVLSLNASWLHARYTSYVSADNNRPNGDGVTVDGNGAPAFNLKGNALSRAPNYTINAAIEYSWDVGAGKMTLRGEGFWSDRVYFTPFNVKALSQAPYQLFNVFLNYDINDNWSVRLYGKNLGDKTIRAGSQSAAVNPLGGPIIGLVQAPRTYGVTVGYRF